jgi:hypothetical protein
MCVWLTASFRPLKCQVLTTGPLPSSNLERDWVWATLDDVGAGKLVMDPGFFLPGFVEESSCQSWDLGKLRVEKRKNFELKVVI